MAYLPNNSLTEYRDFSNTDPKNLDGIIICNNDTGSIDKTVKFKEVLTSRDIENVEKWKKYFSDEYVEEPAPNLMRKRYAEEFFNIPPLNPLEWAHTDYRVLEVGTQRRELLTTEQDQWEFDRASNQMKKALEKKRQEERAAETSDDEYSSPPAFNPVKTKEEKRKMPSYSGDYDTDIAIEERFKLDRIVAGIRSYNFMDSEVLKGQSGFVGEIKLRERSRFPYAHMVRLYPTTPLKEELPIVHLAREATVAAAFDIVAKNELNPVDVFLPKKHDGTCDICGTPLLIKIDDSEKAQKARGDLFFGRGYVQPPKHRMQNELPEGCSCNLLHLCIIRSDHSQGCYTRYKEFCRNQDYIDVEDKMLELEDDRSTWSAIDRNRHSTELGNLYRKKLAEVFFRDIPDDRMEGEFKWDWKRRYRLFSQNHDCATCRRCVCHRLIEEVRILHAKQRTSRYREKQEAFYTEL